MTDMIELAKIDAFPGGAPDQETHDLMAELSDLQTWTLLMTMRNQPKAREAMDLVQKVRAFIVERTFPRALANREDSAK